MKLSVKSASKSHKVLLFGPPKCGKTELAGRLAERFNLKWIDMESGVDTLLKLPEEWKEKIEVISLPDNRSNPIGIETSLKLIKGGKLDICESHGRVGCAICRKEEASFITDLDMSVADPDTIWVFDSLTQLTNSAISQITKNCSDDYKMQFDDWGNLGKLMDIFLSHVQTSKANIVCISHESEVELEDGSIKVVPTAGTRNFSRNTAKYFDEVYYLTVENGKHRVVSSTTARPKVLTGSRHGIKTELQDSPSLIPIFTGEIKAENVMTANSPGSNALANLLKGVKK